MGSNVIIDTIDIIFCELLYNKFGTGETLFCFEIQGYHTDIARGQPKPPVVD